MSVSNLTYWELRSAGSDSNSGGFVSGASGTDRSQSNSAFVTFNGTTITFVTAGVSATITITGYTVTANDVGNILQVAGGTNFTTGFYQILSVNTGANTWTLDRNVSTGVGVAGTGAMGGALATFATINTVAIAGNRVYCVGAFTLTATVTWSINGNSQGAGGMGGGAVWFIGYTSSRGDNGLVNVTTATNSVDLFTYNSSVRCLTFFNFNFTTTASSRASGCLSSGSPWDVGFDNCTWDGFTYGIFADDNSSREIFGLYVRNCEIKNCSIDCIQNQPSTIIESSYLHDARHGIVSFGSGSSRGPQVVLNSVFYNLSGNGIYNFVDGSGYDKSGPLTWVLNTAFVSITGVGLYMTLGSNNGVQSVFCQNNIFYGNGTGVQANNPLGVLLGGYNAFGSNGTDRGGTSWPILPGDFSLSADPFTNKSGADFSLNSTAGGGALCKNTGWPGVSKFGTGYSSVGPLDPNSGGGGSTIVIGRNVTTFLGEQGEF